MHGLNQRILWFLLLWLLVPASAWGDRVELTTGEVLSGTILRLNQNEVSIKLGSSAILSFRMSAVHSIRKTSPDGEQSALVFHRIQNRKAASSEAQPDPKAPPPTARSVPYSTSQPPPDKRPRQPVTADGPSAKKAPPLATTPAPKDPDLVDPEVTDPIYRVAVSPPKGFVRCPQEESSHVILVYKDPFTSASFTVSGYLSNEPIVDIKRGALRVTTQQSKSFHVLRDEKLERAEVEGQPEAWLVEFKSRIATFNVRQLQVFTKNDTNAVILTYSAAEDSFAKHSPAFQRSLLSFHFVGSLEDPSRRATDPTSQDQDGTVTRPSPLTDEALAHPE